MEAMPGEWALSPAIWLLAGILLTLGELATGTMVLLPLGVAALLLAGWLFLQAHDVLPAAVLLDSWPDAALAYGLLAVPALLLLRRLFQTRNRRRDINHY